jgi:hypothetical protein
LGTTNEIGTTTSTAERVSVESIACAASAALTFSTSIGRTMKALLAMNAVSSASGQSPTTWRQLKGVSAATASGMTMNANSSAAAPKTTK